MSRHATVSCSGVEPRRPRIAAPLYPLLRLQRDDDTLQAKVHRPSRQWRLFPGARFPNDARPPLTPSDDAPGLAHAVVSHGFWKNRLGSDPAIIGRTIVLGGRHFTIVGVAARTRPGDSQTRRRSPC